MQGAWYFTDGSHANLLLTGSNLVDESAFNASILNPSVFNSGLPESGVPNGGLSNEELSHWHSDTSGASTGDFHSLGPTNSHTLHEGPQDGNFLTSSNELYNTTAEIIQSTAITATQTIQKPSSPPRPEERNGTACIRCWKLKKKVYQVGRLKCAGTDQFVVYTNECWYMRALLQSLNSSPGLHPSPLCQRADILKQGPIVKVLCRQFQVASPEQTRLFYKVGSGWE
ncbi:MAG: hypothetical protein Q9215_005686 [Flavoplaca cf. flavocitrina]